MWKQKNLPSYLEDSTLVKIYFSVLKILFRTMIPLNLSSEERWNSMDQSKGWVFWTLNKSIIELDGPLSVKTNQRKCWGLPVFSSSTMDYFNNIHNTYKSFGCQNSDVLCTENFCIPYLFDYKPSDFCTKLNWKLVKSLQDRGFGL